MSAIKGTLIPSSFISLRISGIPAKSLLQELLNGSEDNLQLLTASSP